MFDLVDLLGGSQEVELPVAPERQELCRRGGCGQKRAEEDVCIDDQAHCYLRERLLRARSFSLRAPARASSITLFSSSAGTSAKALRAWVTV